MRERILMRLHVIRNETMSNLNVLFREKVQLDERVKQNETDIQFARGYLEALGIVAQNVEEIAKAEQIEAMEFRGDGEKQVPEELAEQLASTLQEAENK